MAERGTPEWWRDELVKKLTADRPKLLRLDRYYEGNHPLPDATPAAEAEFARLMKMSRSNWMGLVVDALCERLEPVGIRLPGSSDADDKAWEIWQANSLDADSELVHTDAAVFSRSYVSVWPEDDSPFPRVAPESPLEMIVATAPGSRRRRLAALKLWFDETTSHWNCTLFLPDYVYKWRIPVQAVITDARSERMALTGWDVREVDGEDWPLPNPLGIVGVIPFHNRTRLVRAGSVGTGRSEIEDVIDIQDRINKTLFDRLMAAEFSAFRQKWATGMAIPRDPTTKEPVEPFDAAVNRLWINENKDGKFGEFEEHDLKNFISAVEADVQHIAAITRTPPHYLLGQTGAFPSGESLKATETGLVAKAWRRIRHHSESWEEVFRVIGVAIGDERLLNPSTEMIWKDPESRTEGELVDALQKMAALGVPNEALWERWGSTPQERERWRQLNAQQRVTDLLAEPERPALPAAP